MEKITLYTTKLGKELCDEGHIFCGSDKRLFDTDLEFTADEDGVSNLVYSEAFDCWIYDVEYIDSVEWI